MLHIVSYRCAAYFGGNCGEVGEVRVMSADKQDSTPCCVASHGCWEGQPLQMLCKSVVTYILFEDSIKTSSP